MKQVMLASVAALALAAASTIAMSQGQVGQGGTAGGVQGGASGSMNAPMNTPGGAGVSGGASGQINESPAPGPGGPGRGAQDRAIPEKQKSTQQAPAKGQAAPQQQGQATPHQQPTQKSVQGAQPPGAKQGVNERREGGSKQGANDRAMTTKNVSLTTEQKTTIRNTVIHSGPKVTNINFDIRVGTVIPRTVRLAPVPTTIISIEPEWRGYMYFVYADEIIIVKPGTLEIVYVLAV